MVTFVLLVLDQTKPHVDETVRVGGPETEGRTHVPRLELPGAAPNHAKGAISATDPGRPKTRWLGRDTDLNYHLDAPRRPQTYFL